MAVQSAKEQYQDEMMELHEKETEQEELEKSQVRKRGGASLGR